MWTLLLTRSAEAATLQVGVSEDFTTLQEAVDAATDGDLILVSAGTYTECVDLGGRSVTIEGEEGADATVLDGGGACEAALSLVLGEQLTLEGFTVTNPGATAIEVEGGALELVDVDVTGSGASHLYGGGIHLDSATLRWEGGRASENTAYAGGAVYALDDAALELVDLILEDNVARYGGGVYAMNDVVLSVQGASLSRNQATAYGAAFYGYWDVQLTLEGALVEENEAEGSGAFYLDSAHAPLRITSSTFSTNNGGALKLVEGELEIVDSTFTGNVGTNGGALSVSSASQVRIEGSVFSGNLSEYSAGAAWLHGRGYGTLEVSDTRFVANESSVSGGAAYINYFASVTLEGLDLRGNRAKSGGALVAFNQTQMKLQASRLCGNEADSGAGLYLLYALGGAESVELSNNLFVNNVAADVGGAIYANDGQGLAVYNNTFVGNTSGEAGSALWLFDVPVHLVNNLVAWSEGGAALQADDGYSATLSDARYDAWHENAGGDQGGDFDFDLGADGHLSGDPGLVAWTNDGDCAGDDLRLSAGSPLIDAGDPTLTDPDGSRSDIGAYGGPGAAALSGTWGDTGDTEVAPEASVAPAVGGAGCSSAPIRSGGVALGALCLILSRRRRDGQRIRS